MQYKAFTLAELLISLMILGVIATFTIPKVLTANQNAKFNAIAREVIGMVSAAHQAYQLNTQVSSSTKFSDFTPYMNYVATDTTTDVDYYQGTGGAYNCSWERCLKLHNGAIIYYDTGMSFNGTGTLSGISFLLDPDGRYSGTSTGPGKSLEIYIYANGRITSSRNIRSSTTNSDGTFNPCGNCDPSWFSWN